MGFIPSLSNKVIKRKFPFRGSCLCDTAPKQPFSRDDKKETVKYRGRGIAADTATSLIYQLDNAKKMNRNQSLKWIKDEAKSIKKIYR